MIILEFITQFLTEGARIDHPEDLVFSEGSAGATRALKALLEIPKRTDQVTIKWDGFPALVFGRNVDGQLVVADKHMFTKSDGSGRVTSLNAFIQYDVNRGANRGDLYEKLRILWPALEQAVPKGAQGYYWGDLMWVGQLKPQQGSYVFKPNTVTYRIPANSAMGKRIGNCVAGIAVHSYFSDFDSGAQPLNGHGQLNDQGPLCILTSQIPDKVAVKEPVQLVKSAQTAISRYGTAVDAMLDPISLAQYKIKDLGALMQKYVNARVRGETRSFTDWLPTSVTANKLNTLLGENGYLHQHKQGLEGAFSMFQTIMNLKDNLVKQLDSQQKTVQASVGSAPGGEGYVFNTSQGTIKMVNRASFSAANFASNG